MPKLRDIRESRLMSQDALSHKAGRSSKTISNIERGVGNSSLKTKQNIADALHVNPSDIDEFQQELVEENKEAEKPEPEEKKPESLFPFDFTGIFGDKGK